MIREREKLKLRENFKGIIDYLQGCLHEDEIGKSTIDRLTKMHQMDLSLITLFEQCYGT